MKPDERDIICEQDYSPLSNAELLAHIETYAGLIYDMPLAERGRWQDEILGPARVLLERIEAAEALAYERLEAALFAEQRATDAELRAEEELEAQRESGDETNGFIDSLIAALDHPIRGDEVFLSEIVETATALKARVAELEAQLAAAHLNPYNTAPLAEHVIVTLRTEGWRDEDGLWDWDDYGDWDVVGWQPLPPAPAPQEATP